MNESLNPGLVLKFESSRQPNLRNGIQRPQKNHKTTSTIIHHPAIRVYFLFSCHLISKLVLLPTSVLFV